MDALQGLYRPETYTIGFTENRYSSMDDEILSPSPTEPNKLGYSSTALDYAERTNKGAENIFLDRSLSLEREKHKSVGKINNGILDLVFELTERRKTPLLSRSFKEDMLRCDSRLSDCSSVSLKSSGSSGPMVNVQQLPPRELVLPDINPNAQKTEASKKTKNGKRGKKKRGNNSGGSLPRFQGLVNTVIEQNRSLKEENQSDHSKQKQDESEENDTVAKEREKSGFHASGKIKWQFITEKLMEANKLVRDGGVDLDRYKGRYHTPEYSSTSRRLSYCQCSYEERRERERINNIRRRHMSQARTGPLDFNKLKRQITTGRSLSFVY